jgi:hypothetical protein
MSSALASSALTAATAFHQHGPGFVGRTVALLREGPGGEGNEDRRRRGDRRFADHSRPPYGGVWGVITVGYGSVFPLTFPHDAARLLFFELFMAAGR